MYLFTPFYFRRSILSTFLPLSLLSANVFADGDAAEQQALLKSIVAQNSAAFKRADPLYVEFSWHSQSHLAAVPYGDDISPSGDIVSDGRTKIWRSGELYHQDMDLTHRWIGTERTSDVSSIAVCNKNFFALYDKNARYLTIYRFDSLQSLYAPANKFVSLYPFPKIMQFGFGTESESLGEYFERQGNYDPPLYSWSLKSLESEGKLKYMLLSNKIRGRWTGPWSEFVVDPERGFLTTEHRWFNSSGKVILELTAELQSLSSGHWFPKTGKRTSTDSDETSEFVVEKVHLGEAIPLSQFEVTSMEMELHNTRMREFTNSGRDYTDRAYWNGEWVSLSMLPLDALEAFREARRQFAADPDATLSTEEKER